MQIGSARNVMKADPVHGASARARLGAGFLTGVLNPKAIMFSTAFLAQFIEPSAPQFRQFMILMATSALVVALVPGVYALLSTKLSARLQSPRAGGSCLLGGSVLMATARECALGSALPFAGRIGRSQHRPSHLAVLRVTRHRADQPRPATPAAPPHPPVGSCAPTQRNRSARPPHHRPCAGWVVRRGAILCGPARCIACAPSARQPRGHRTNGPARHRRCANGQRAAYPACRACGDRLPSQPTRQCARTPTAWAGDGRPLRGRRGCAMADRRQADVQGAERGLFSDGGRHEKGRGGARTGWACRRASRGCGGGGMWPMLGGGARTRCRAAPPSPPRQRPPE